MCTKKLMNTCVTCCQNVLGQPVFSFYACNKKWKHWLSTVNQIFVLLLLTHYCRLNNFSCLQQHKYGFSPGFEHFRFNFTSLHIMPHVSLYNNIVNTLSSVVWWRSSLCSGIQKWFQKEKIIVSAKNERKKKHAGTEHRNTTLLKKKADIETPKCLKQGILYAFQ